MIPNYLFDKYNRYWLKINGVYTLVIKKNELYINKK